jgi:hypothetical protein
VKGAGPARILHWGRRVALWWDKNSPRPGTRSEALHPEPAPSNLACCGIDGSRLNSDAGGITLGLQKLKLGDAACDPDGIGGARSRGDWSFPTNPKALIRDPCLLGLGGGRQGRWGAHRRLAAAAWFARLLHTQCFGIPRPLPTWLGTSSSH